MTVAEPFEQRMAILHSFTVFKCFELELRHSTHLSFEVKDELLGLYSIMVSVLEREAEKIIGPEYKDMVRKHIAGNPDNYTRKPDDKQG